MLLRALPHLLLVFLTLIYKVSCQGASLTFVIDDTRSMGDDIAQVRSSVDSIMDIVLHEKSSQISNIGLVTFNDPAVRERLFTKDRNELKAAMSHVKVNNYFNYDCPEMALSGVKKALESSLPGSFIYVFTDASAKDYSLSEEIKQLCQRKQSQVSFVLTGDCKRPYSKKFRVFYDIATASSGLAFRVNKNEVKDVLHTIEETIKGNKTVLTSKVTPAGESTDVPFWIDDLTEYAIISASGTDVTLQIQEPLNGHAQIEKVMWTRNGKVVKIKDPNPGKYVATVKGSTATSVVITGRSDFLFQHGFSELEPKSIDDTSVQPFSDTMTHLSLSVKDPKHSVKIQSAQILDMKENVIEELSLKELSPDFYTTEPFVAPSHMFKVAVIGEDNKTGKPVRRISKIPITPAIPPPGIPLAKAPVVEIKEGASTDVPRGGPVTLTCKVSAFPKPEITWTNEKGVIVQSTSSRVELPYDYISYLKISKVTEGAKYHCHAKNVLKEVQKTIDVVTKDPITINTVPKGTTKIAYGTGTTLNCNVRSQLPMKITWYRVNKLTGVTEHITSSEKYAISSDGTELKILSMDVELVGKYTCKAYLKEDPNEKREFSTNVEIYGLVAPKIDPDSNPVTVVENKPATIECKILKAVPRPTISWQFKATGSASSSYQAIAGSGAELHIPSAGLHDAGSYRCVASNVEGRDEQTVAELVVVKAPVVTIKEGADTTVPYGSRLTLTCEVTAHPPPTVTWTDDRGNTLPATVSGSRNKFESTYTATNMKESGKYMCRAENNQGHNTEIIQVTVTPAFRVQAHSPDTIEVSYGNRVDLTCDIKSPVPMKIEWYYASDRANASKRLISSDKKYQTSSGGTVLQITSMDMDLKGAYTCKATLIEDLDVSQSFTTNIDIGGLVAPKIDPDSNPVTVVENKPATIECKILKAVPRPTISWQFKATGSASSSYQAIAGSGAELHIPSAGLHDAGSYRCVASNVEGRDEQTVAELVVVKAPVVTIKEGADTTVPYGSRLTLTCEVTAHPQPTVTWTDDRGNTLPATVSGSRNKFESTYTATNMKESGKYMCRAENNQGHNTETIQVTVTPAFRVQAHSPDTIEVSYGNRVDLTCDIKSPVPMKIEWYYASDRANASKRLISSDKKYQTSSDGTVLQITSMDMDLKGAYTCKATLIEDPDVSLSFTTNIDIGGLVQPEIDPLPIKIEINETEPAVIRCKILNGVPKPKISWQMKAAGSSVFRSITASGSEELRIEKAALANGGHYKCVAENVAGLREQVVAELVVLKAPAVTIVEGTSMNVPYGSRLTLTCRVTANPAPTVVWKDSAGNTLPAPRKAVKSVNKLVSLKSVKNGFEHTYTLTRVNVRASGNYSCSAINDQGSASESVLVSVSSPFKIPSQLPDSTTGKYGSEVHIKCGITSNSPMKIRWYHVKDSTSEEKEIVASDQYTILSNGAELKINSMDVGLDGKYTCKASLLENPKEHVDHTSQVQIDGLEAPEIIGNENQKSRVGESVSIKCNVVKGVPKPKLSWHFKHTNSDKYADINNTGNVWYISNVTLDHSGFYMCTAKNSKGTSEHIVALTVEEPPRIIAEEFTEYEGIVGDIALRIPCETVGSPKPTIEWKVNGSDVTPDNKYVIEDGALVIKNPEWSTSNYTCTATNAAGSDSKTFIGVVDDTFTDYGTIHDVYILKGDSKNVTCSLPRSDSSSVKWFIEPQSITHIDTPYVTVENAKLNDDGNYTCHVSDIHGSATETFVVDVGYPPTFKPSPQGSVLEWSGDTEDVLSCGVRAKPEANIEWTFNGEPIVGSTDLNIFKWGHYKCNVSNVHGAVQKEFEVKPTVCLISRKGKEISHMPLMLTEELTWPELQTSGEYMIMKPGDNLMLSCYNHKKSPNSFRKFPALGELQATCDSGDTFIVDGKPYELKDLQCTNEIYPSVVKTNSKCLTETSELMRVGYNLGQFVEAYEVCFDYARNIPLYTRVLMSHTNNVPSALHKWFRYPEIGNGRAEAYTCETSSSSCCYAKTQLASATDFSYGAAQNSSFIYPLNAIPLWRPCDSDRTTWEKVEDIVRTRLDINPNIVVWSGVHLLQDDKNGAIAPRYLWKVVRENEDESIAIVYVNAATPTAADIKCDNICAGGDGSWYSTSDKYTYCCTLTDFLDAFDIPGEVLGETPDQYDLDQIPTDNIDI